MKSFRHIAFVLAAAALAAGCTKTEVSAPEREITFSVGSYVPATKAEALQAVDGITSFKSKGYLYAEGVDGTQDFFGSAGETISWDGTNKVWGPSHPYYWPKSDNSYVNFVSWYAKESDTDLTPATLTETSLSWVMDGSTAAKTVGPKANIMFADVAWRYNQNPSAVYGSTPSWDTEHKTTQGVPTLFHHALSQVRFMAVATATTEEGSSTTWNVYIENFRIADVRKTGSISLVNSDLGYTGTKAWKSMDGEEQVNPYWVLPETTPTAADTLSHMDRVSIYPAATPVPVMNTRSVIPQSTEGLVMRFDCIIRTNYSVSYYIEEVIPVEISLSSFSNDIDSWDMNQRTTYTVNINPIMGKILFAPALSEGWSSSTNNMYVE